jgi:hypothetical protein
MTQFMPKPIDANRGRPLMNRNVGIAVLLICACLLVYFLKLGLLSGSLFVLASCVVLFVVWKRADKVIIPSDSLELIEDDDPVIH